MFKQVIDFACEVIQGNLVNRGVDSVFDSLSENHNSDSDLENMESNFNSLMARAEDLLKEILTKEEQGRKRKREVDAWFEGVKKVEDKYHAFKKEESGWMKQIFGGDEALKKLHARILDLDNRSQLFGELVLVDDDTTRGLLPRPTTELEGAAFQDNFQRIWELLENDQVLSIGVHGMGGVGKSTLVEHIHNQLLERKKCVFWVVVSSQRCSIKMLQDKISRKLGLDLSGEDEDVGARAGRLSHALSRRHNFVLILDDVWERFDLVKVGVPVSMKGCKWMMTSRSRDVCQQMKCQEMILVKPLGEDEGWNLFLKNLGQDATSALRNPQVEKIGKRMVGICDGLPLGIITLAGAVSGVTEIREWRHELRVLEESVMGHEWMEENVFRVLKYSYDRLNLNDQLCFLYCALYPEDFVILTDELIRNLIREELVDEKKSWAAQRDEGYSIVNRLVKVSLLESGGHWKGESVKMHDLVRGMANKITRGKTIVISGQSYNRKQIPVEEEWTKDLEKVSLMMNWIEEIPHGISPNCPKLTTLILRDNPLRGGIASSFFTHMCGLRTLDLSDTHIEELPDSVSDLVNLTSLLLGGCRELEHVPCMRKLKKLRELDLSMTSIEDGPQGMEELRLQHLRLPWHIEADQLVEVGERLEVFLGRLKHFSDFNRLVAAKQDGISYFIVVGDPGDRFEDYYNDFEYNKDGTRELHVFGYDLNGGEGNEFTTILAADHIQQLELSSCEGMSKCLLNDMSNPISLEKLVISDSQGIECLLTHEQFKSSKPLFQALEDIELCQLDDFMGVIHKLEIEDATLFPPPPCVFPSIRSLEIFCCKKMKKLGLPLFAFEKVEYIRIEECEEIEEIIQVAAAGAISLPNLEVLKLIRLPSLESFCGAPLTCNLLRYFKLVECPRLEVPFLNWGTPDSCYPIFPGKTIEEIRRKSL